MTKLIFLPVLMLFGVGAVVLPSWEITDDYAVRFSTKKAAGTFSDLQGKVIFDPEDLANSSFDVSVATASIQTGNTSKDKHARGKSWFDADNHPRIRFVSTQFTPTDDGYTQTKVVWDSLTRKGPVSTAILTSAKSQTSIKEVYTVLGDLSIKGITKPTSISFSFEQTPSGGLFTGKTNIVRADFALDGPFLLGGLVGDEVAVELQVPVTEE